MCLLLFLLTCDFLSYHIALMAMSLALGEWRTNSYLRLSAVSLGCNSPGNRRSTARSSTATEQGEEEGEEEEPRRLCSKNRYSM